MKEHTTSRIEIVVKPDGTIGLSVGGTDRRPIALIGILSTAIKGLHDNSDASASYSTKERTSND